MKLLVISDYFYKLIETNGIEYIKWGEYHPLALRGYDCLLVDMTFESSERLPETIRLLYELKVVIEKPNFLSKNNLILVVICGSPVEEFKFDEAYDSAAVDKVYFQDKPFGNYDFLKAVIPAHNRLEFDEGKHVYSLAQIPILLYFLRYKNGPTYLSYDYDPDHEDCIDVIPLAKMKEKGRACVAFECRNGRGSAVILPSYDHRDKENAYVLLLRICNSYFKKSMGINELIEEYIDKTLPDLIRDAFIEAIICFSYDLYTSSLLMCRRALEESAILQGATDKGFLRTKIEDLYSKNLIDNNLKEIAVEIIEFGNWGAHPGKFRGKQISGEDVISVIEFLQIYFNYVHRIPKKLKESAERRRALERKEAF